MTETARILGGGDGAPASLRLEDIHPFWGGRRLELWGDGRVRLEVHLPAGPVQVMEEVDAASVAGIFALMVEVDLLASVATEPYTPAPDEACPVIVCRGVTRSAWSNQEYPEFQQVYQALLDLERRLRAEHP